MSNRRSRINRSAKAAVFERDEWRCRYCGKGVIPAGLDQPQHAHNTATIDHVRPLIAGGTNEQTNLACACYACNHSKGGSTGDIPRAPVLADVWPDLADHERAMFGGVA